MAGTPAPIPATSDPNNQWLYWCYHCEKRVSVETLADHPDLVCGDCKFGFVESIPSPPESPPSETAEFVDELALGSQFVQVLRLIAQVARDEAEPPLLPENRVDPPSDDDFLRIELNGWGNGNENENENENDDEDGEDAQNSDQEEEDTRRRRRDDLRRQLREFANRAAQGEERNRIHDWGQILMGFVADNSTEFRFEMPDTEQFFGDLGDYVDAAGYDALLQNLAETEGSRGAPPASKSVIAALRTVEIKSEEQSYVCVVCKDAVGVGGFSKELPCGHGYHVDCIGTWLEERNSCPVCRFELATDDPEYEEEKQKKKKRADSTSAGASSGLAGGNQ